MNDKQNIKRQRIKTYFLEAAKEIILKEGVENVSVRKVADIAGYSYATIYNYFTDLNGLLWDVKGVMISDLGEYVLTQMDQVTCDTDGIKRLFRIYMTYYFENPKVFQFFYLYPLSNPDKKSGETEMEPDYQAMWNETFKGFVQKGVLDAKDIEVVAKTFIYSMHGMLAMCFSHNGDLTQDKAYEDMEKMVDYLLK